MPKKRKQRSTAPESGPFAGLYSRGILRAIVKALDLGKGGTLTERTARRFIRHSNPNKHNRRKFFLALGQTIIDMGFVPDLAPHMPLRVSSAQVYGDSIEFAANRWDSFMSRIQSEGSWDVDVVTAGRCFLGLAAVDLSLRLLGLSWMAGVDVRLPETPLWAEENGIGRILKVGLSDTGLNRGQLAGRLEVSETTVDNWLDGRNWPGDQYIDSLAREFARGDLDQAGLLAAELRRQFALGKLCQLLAERVGRDNLLSAVDAVSRFARDLAELVGPRLVPEPVRPAVGSALFLAGSEVPPSHDILRFLAAGYPDGAWRDIILAAAVPWELAFNLARGMEDGPKSAAAGLAQDYLEVVDESGRPDALAVREATCEVLGGQIDSFIPRGPLPIPEHHPLSVMEEGIHLRRRLVERFPNSPEVHLQLGSWLGKVGQLTGDREFVDRGLLECRIAAGLCPAWDNPAVERGIILTNFGARQEALDELEQVAQELPSLTPHWRFNMGYVLTMLERFSEGLEHLEEVVRIRSDYALAYRYAAHSAFRVGNGVKGRDYAKRARRLGDSTEFDAWQRGEYRARR